VVIRMISINLVPLRPNQTLLPPKFIHTEW